MLVMRSISGSCFPAGFNFNQQQQHLTPHTQVQNTGSESGSPWEYINPDEAETYGTETRNQPATLSLARLKGGHQGQFSTALW